MSDREPTDAPAEEPEAEPAPEPEPEPEPAPEEEPAPEPSGEQTAATEAPSAPPVGARRLERSREDRVIAGVCGGLGEYFGVDAVLIRIAALVLLFAGGAGALLYLIGWIAMPEGPEATAAGAAPGTTPAHAPAERTTGAVAIGAIFILLGAFFLVDEIWDDFLAWKYVWPIVLIAVGAAVLVRARR